MPRSIRNPEGWTLRKLVSNTFTHARSRFTYKERDVLKGISIKQISVYDGRDPGEARTKFIVESSSYPQYPPYYTGRDVRGRPIQYQRTYKHFYDVTLQMDTLSLDDDRIHLRTGADAKWDFSDKGKGKWVGRGRQRRFIEGTNIQRGLNGDFFFRLSFIRHQNGLLYGRNYAGWFPRVTNPHGIQFLTKHELMVIEVLTNRGILK